MIRIIKESKNVKVVNNLSDRYKKELFIQHYIPDEYFPNGDPDNKYTYRLVITFYRNNYSSQELREFSKDLKSSYSVKGHSLEKDDKSYIDASYTRSNKIYVAIITSRSAGIKNAINKLHEMVENLGLKDFNIEKDNS